MRYAGLPLAVLLLFCCYCAASAAASASSSSATPVASPVSSSKPKRDAALSFGSLSSYHGPSHKYLPPAYENHLSFGGAGGGGGGGYHGNALGSGHAYTEYAHLEGGDHHYGSSHGHGYGYSSGSSSSHGSRPHHYSSGGSGGPKIETYIVQTSSGSAGSHGYAGAHGLSHGGSHGLSHGLSHGVSHGLSHGLSHGVSHGHGSGLGYKYGAPSSGAASSYLNLLGNGHKTSTYIVATPEYSAAGGSHGIGYGSGPVHGRPSFSSHGSHGYSHGFGHHISHGPPSHGPSHSLDHSLEHALEHGLTQALGLGGHGSSSVGGGGHYAQHPIPEEHSGYTYDAPATPFGKGTPLTSYGVPLIPGYDHQESLHQESPVQVQILEQSDHKVERERDQERETPVYALGHKGLGHFTYTASKPQALHTDIHAGASSASAGHDLELSKAPFKPSAFLGAKHESSGSNAISGSGYDYATPTSPFLQSPPPSSPGYDYPAPAQLYGPPGHSGDSATPIFEPEATYLPPASSYLPPATPTHGYH